MRNKGIKSWFWADLAPVRLGAVGSESATREAGKTSTPAPVDPLVWASPARAADASKIAAPMAASLGAVRGPLRIFFGAGALAMLAAAFGLGAGAARSEPGAPADASISRNVDPLHWGSAPEPARATKTTSLVSVSSDAVGTNPASEEIVVGVGVFGLLAVSLEVFRRARRRKRRLQTLYEVTEALPPPAEGRAPRFLSSNPYLDPFGPRRLVRQIENAAEASLDFGRVLGVVFFDLGNPRADEEGRAAADWAEAAADLVFKLQTVLRPTDHVALLDDRYLVVCIALLPGMTELIGIGERMRGIGQTSTIFAAAFARRAGLAIFPLCGYRGDELIDYARMDFHARNGLAPASLQDQALALESASGAEA